jgi:TonB family protein
MSTAGSRLALAILHLWTRLYTAGLPRPERQRRREEIEADAWETAHAERFENGVPASIQILARLLRGVVDDIGWRMEREVAMTRSGGVRVAAIIVVGLVAAWVIAALRTPLPPQPAVPQPLLLATLAAPPPPPPPPTLPGEHPADVTFTYADVSYVAVNGAPPPARLNDIRPVHPPIARMNGVGGTVVVDATIDERGRVADARIRQSVPMLDQSAIDAVRQWVFQPSRNDTTPTTIVLRVTLTYPIPLPPAATPR